MKRDDYLKRALDLYNSGKIDGDTYDCMLINMDDLIEDDESENMQEYCLDNTDKH